jgi:hypothetical protein
MSMPTEPQPVMLTDVVRRAVEACDDGSSEALDELLTQFEDADVPVATIEDIEATLDEAIGPVDADEDPALAMARASSSTSATAGMRSTRTRSTCCGSPPAPSSATIRPRASPGG